MYVPNSQTFFQVRHLRRVEYKLKYNTVMRNFIFYYMMLYYNLISSNKI